MVNPQMVSWIYEKEKQGMSPAQIYDMLIKQGQNRDEVITAINSTLNNSPSSSQNSLDPIIKSNNQTIQSKTPNNLNPTQNNFNKTNTSVTQNNNFQNQNQQPNQNHHINTSTNTLTNIKPNVNPSPTNSNNKDSIGKPLPENNLNLNKNSDKKMKPTIRDNKKLILIAVGIAVLLIAIILAGVFFIGNSSQNNSSDSSEEINWEDDTTDNTDAVNDNSDTFIDDNMDSEIDIDNNINNQDNNMEENTNFQDPLSFDTSTLDLSETQIEFFENFIGNCYDLVNNLATCTPYECEFTDSITKDTFKREIVGKAGNECSYIEDRSASQKYECLLSDETINTIIMQLNSLDPETTNEIENPINIAVNKDECEVINNYPDLDASDPVVTSPGFGGRE